MKETLADVVIGTISFLWFAIQYIFCRTRCCICNDKILRGEIKYRVKEYMDTINMCFRTRNPVCTRCTNRIRKNSNAEITCLNE